ncbi:MAG TPA: tetratricopeptide repeat protein, partial [Bacteroidetes bacterium]|nr:tetratricopeptide repeat protein [Bacteroidota bacterium]
MTEGEARRFRGCHGLHSGRSKATVVALWLLIAAGGAASLHAQPMIIAPDPEALLRGETTVEEVSAAELSALRTRWMFNAYRDAYYARKQTTLDREMLLRERFLLGLFKGVLREAKQRDDLDVSLIESAPFAADTLPAPEIPDSVYISIADYYQLTHDYVRREYEQKLVFAEAVKGRLVRDGDSSEVKRMFDYDLKLASRAYAGNDYPLAILRFNHILGVYPYHNLDDILYYRSEAQYALKHYLSAAAGYRRLLEEYPESEYRPDALARLFYIYQRLNRFSIVKELWDQYGSVDFGFDSILSYDEQWNALLDSLSAEDLSKEESKRLNEALDELEKNVPYTSEQVDQASRLYYAAGLGLYLGGYYAEAHDAFRRVPEYTPNEYKAAFLNGDSFLRLKQYENAIEPFRFLAETRFGRDEPEYVLGNEAMVRLGYSYFELSRFSESREAFLQVDKRSDSYKYALVGLAWTAAKMNRFTEVDSLTKLIRETYPEDPVYYEAVALGGFNSELLGRRNEALDVYREMLETLNRLTDVRGFLLERRRIAERIKEVKGMEESVLASGDPDLFLEYLRVGQRLDRLYQRVKLAEVVELNPRVGEYLAERDSVRKLYDELGTVRDTIESEQFASLRGSYKRIEMMLQKLSAMVQMGGFAEANRATVTQQASEIQLHNEITDTLVSRSERELVRIHRALRELQEAEK